MLLLINGIGAVYGGMHLMFFPDGSSIQLTSEWLRFTPFTNYLIPGIILFIFNGLFSLFVFISILINHSKYLHLVLIQGFILLGWICIQMLLIRTIYFLHIIMLAIGILMIITAAYQLRKRNNPTERPKSN